MNLKGFLSFRGCLNDLEKESLQIVIFCDNYSIFKFFQAKHKIIYPLRGISTSTYFIKKIPNNNTLDQKECSIWGKLSLKGLPRFFQKVDSTEFSSENFQFCITIESLNLQNLPTIYKSPKYIIISIELVH